MMSIKEYLQEQIQTMVLEVDDEHLLTKIYTLLRKYVEEKK